MADIGGVIGALAAARDDAGHAKANMMAVVDVLSLLLECIHTIDEVSELIVGAKSHNEVARNLIMSADENADFSEVGESLNLSMAMDDAGTSITSLIQPLRHMIFENTGTMQNYGRVGIGCMGDIEDKLQDLIGRLTAT